MIEPIFTQRNAVARRHIVEDDPASVQHARDAALLHRALGLAIESAFVYGMDMPVGAVAANDEWIIGRYYASDRRLDWTPMHAEKMALIDANYNRTHGTPATLVVTLEPCESCQDFIADPQWSQIKRVGFGLSRAEVAERGLVKSHAETAAERVSRMGYPYEVFKVEDEMLHKAGGIVLDHVRRDTSTGIVRVDQQSLNEALIELNVLG